MQRTVSLCLSLPLLSLLLLLTHHPAPACGLGLFFRTPWVHEVAPATLAAWFDLIAWGRAQGPGSPYYVEYLAVQNIACNQMDPLGPPCNASAPTNSKQALGNSSLPYGTVWESDLAVLSQYFHLFDVVYVGTMWVDDWNWWEKDSNTRAAEQQAKVAQRFLELYPSVPNMAWYVTLEGSLNDIGSSQANAANFADFLSKTVTALRGLRDLPVLWSPAVTSPFSSYTPQQLLSLQTNLVTLFDSLPSPIHMHFQDFLGQSVTFVFPFFYNYSVAFTCEADTVPYFDLFSRVAAATPKLAEVKVNMELFAERLSPSGEHGENNGANIINANPAEIALRSQCYARHHLPIGACWALPHWYYIWTYANATVYAPY